jgi:hypothetical protein
MSKARVEISLPTLRRCSKEEWAEMQQIIKKAHPKSLWQRFREWIN